MSNGIKTIGYIGLGIMGAPMAGNLIDAGYELLVFNRTASKAKPLAERGARVCESPADVAGRGPGVVCLNVTDTPDVEAVLFGEDGIASTAKPGLIVVDHSTIDPGATEEFARRLAEQDVTLIDAPVSGGDVGAQQGTLSIMVGGPGEAVEKIRPMLEVVGGSVNHVGGVSKGQACKACNQVAVALTLLGVAEAMALAGRTGLDLSKMIEVVGGGAGGSWQLKNLGPKIAAGDHAPGFMVDYILKDLGIVADTARRAKLPLTGTALAESYFRSVSANGGGELGTQAIAKALERLGGFAFEDLG